MKNKFRIGEIVIVNGKGKIYREFDTYIKIKLI